MKTSQPARRRCWLMANPMPWAPAVMRARLPRSFVMGKWLRGAAAQPRLRPGPERIRASAVVAFEHAIDDGRRAAGGFAGAGAFAAAEQFVDDVLHQGLADV